MQISAEETTHLNNASICVFCLGEGITKNFAVQYWRAEKRSHIVRGDCITLYGTSHSVQVQTHSPFVPFVSPIMNITYYSWYSYDSSTFWAPTLYTITNLKFATARRSSLPVTSPAWFNVNKPTVGFFLRIFPKDFSNGVFKLSATAKALCRRSVDNVKISGCIPLFLFQIQLSFIPVSILFYFHRHLVLLHCKNKGFYAVKWWQKRQVLILLCHRTNVHRKWFLKPLKFLCFRAYFSGA